MWLGTFNEYAINVFGTCVDSPSKETKTTHITPVTTSRSSGQSGHVDPCPISLPPRGGGGDRRGMTQMTHGTYCT